MFTQRTRCGTHGCHRTPTGEDGLCGPHRAGAARRSANDQARREQRVALEAQARARAARQAYADAWRAEHPEIAYTRPRECPLCGLYVQSTLEAAGAEHAYAPSRADAKAHEDAHGAAWAAYQALWRADG